MQQLAILVSFLFFSASALAVPDTETEVRRLTTLLDTIRQEQLSVYQQFQMAESLQRSEAKSADPVVDVQEGRVAGHEDAVRVAQEQRGRLKYHADEMRRLSDRYREPGNQGAALVEQIRVLALSAR